MAQGGEAVHIDSFIRASMTRSGTGTMSSIAAKYISIARPFFDVSGV